MPADGRGFDPVAVGRSAAGWLSAGRPRREAFRVGVRLTARGGMRELVIRAHVHRARLGQTGAAEAARLAAAGVDNPVLAELVAAEF